MDIEGQQGNLNTSSPAVDSVSPQETSIPTSGSANRTQHDTTSSTPRDLDEANEGDDSKSHVKNEYWQHFQRYKVDGEWKKKCKHCGNVLGSNPRHGTKTLKNHVQFYCKRLKRINSKQSTIAECFAKQGKSGDYCSFDPELARRCLAEAIIVHEYPLSIVDHVKLRRLFSVLQPSFNCPSRNTIKKDILTIYEEEKLNMTKALDQIGSRVAITSDIWTSSNQQKGYMVVTAHYIDSSWKLQNKFLSFAYVPTPHTSDMLTNTLMKIMLEWNIDRKLSTITLDNCSTNDAMVDDLLGRLDGEYLLLRGKLLHMRCCAHILNLIVKDGLDIIKESIEKIRNSVLYWSATPKRHETFVAWCSKSGVSFTKKLVLDCPTRWNSTYLMLESALLYKNVFHRLRQKEPQYKSVPSSDEWELAKEICDKLKVFYNVSQLFSGTQYPTANLFFPKVCEIKLALTEWMSSSNLIISHMACNMMEKFEKYWNDIHGIMSVAAVLDPRYKITLLEFYFSRLYQLGCSRQVERIQQICYDLINEYQAKKDSSTSSVPEHSTNETIGSVDNLTDYDLFVRTKKKARPLMKTELDFYLDEDVLPRAPDFDILVWWKINGAKYPTLQQIARDLYAIPVSTIASESAFSASGRLISPHRSKLKEDTIEALMCSHNWLCTAETKDEDPCASSYKTIIEEEEDVDQLGA